MKLLGPLQFRFRYSSPGLTEWLSEKFQQYE